MTEQGAPQDTKDLPWIIKIKPGVAQGKSVTGTLPPHITDSTFSEAIRYALTDKRLPRAEQRIAANVDEEMKKQHNIIANGQHVQPNEAIRPYFKEEMTESGLKYHGLEVVIAAKQEGGLSAYLLR